MVQNWPVLFKIKQGKGKYFFRLELGSPFWTREPLDFAHPAHAAAYFRNLDDLSYPSTQNLDGQMVN